MWFWGAPALPDVPPQSLRRAQDRVAGAGSRAVLLPGSPGIPAHRDDGLRLAQRCDRLVRAFSSSTCLRPPSSGPCCRPAGAAPVRLADTESEP